MKNNDCLKSITLKRLKTAIYALIILSAQVILQDCDAPPSSVSIENIPYSVKNFGHHFVPQMSLPNGESHWLEAEYPNSLTGLFQIKEDEVASGSAFLYVSDSDNGKATYKFTVQESGEYAVWGRMLGPDTSSDTFYMSISDGLNDDINKFPWKISTGTWHWERIHTSENQNNTFYFQSGIQAINIEKQEPGAMIDKFLITEDLEYTPYFAEILEIDKVWSGHSVRFALVTSKEYQYIAYYDKNRQMRLAMRELGTNIFTYNNPDSFIGWDSHNYISMALDRDNLLHVTGNMHNVPLTYYKTMEVGNISSLVPKHTMIGTEENSVSYPKYFYHNGWLIFHYRNGHSGNGKNYFNIFDESKQKWLRLFNTPLFDGNGYSESASNNAYYLDPVQDMDGIYHVIFVWRKNSDASTCHNISHAQSQDLLNWENSKGDPIDLPITVESGEIIDPVPINGGLLNTTFYMGFDNLNRLVVTYHKYDKNGYSQIYNARFEDEEWKIFQMSDWTGRWDFGGGGTLVSGIPGQGPVRVEMDGSLTQTYQGFDSKGVWLLDEENMTVLGNYIRHDPVFIPNSLKAIETECSECRDHNEEMKIKYQFSEYQNPYDTPENFQYFLRWESLGANRDSPRNYNPPESTLRLYTSRPLYKGEPAENLPF